MALPEEHVATGPRESAAWGASAVVRAPIPGCDAPGGPAGRELPHPPSAGLPRIRQHPVALMPRVGSKPGPGVTARWTPVDLPQTAGEQSRTLLTAPSTTADKEGCGCNF